MDLLLTVSENQFCVVLHWINVRVIKYIKKFRSNFSKQIIISVSCDITFSFEDDDQKPVDFNGETLYFTCQLVRILFSNPLRNESNKI